MDRLTGLCSFMFLTCIFFLHDTTAAVPCSVPSTPEQDFNIDYSDDENNYNNNNHTQQQQEGRFSYCDHGCCPRNSNGCCYDPYVKSRDDIIAYCGSAFGVFFFISLVIYLTCRKQKRKNPPRQSRNQGQEVPAPLPYADGPPSYWECAVSSTSSSDERIPSSTTNNSDDGSLPVSMNKALPLSVDGALPLRIDGALPLSMDNVASESLSGASNHLPPPPAYKDIFKEAGRQGEHYQIAVISETGEVSFRENYSFRSRNDTNRGDRTHGSGHSLFNIDDGSINRDTDSNNNTSHLSDSQIFDVTRL